jgi:hypothetical protein
MSERCTLRFEHDSLLGEVIFYGAGTSGAVRDMAHALRAHGAFSDVRVVRRDEVEVDVDEL